MKNCRLLRIGDRDYPLVAEVDQYQVPLGELGGLKFRDIPWHSHVEIVDLPEPPENCSFELYVVNGEDKEGEESFFAYGGATARVRGDLDRLVARFKRTFPQPTHHGFFPNPNISVHEDEAGQYVNGHLHLDYPGSQDSLVKDAVLPFVQVFVRLSLPEVVVFVCHASEDKQAARAIATHLKLVGCDVWFDEWEIRVGDSIVEKIDQALIRATHILVLLSSASISKPWVSRELSSSLMRQLQEQSVRVLPVRLDDCQIPALLADIRYADARGNISMAAAEIEKALFTS